jgi:hypothetical protein
MSEETASQPQIKISWLIWTLAAFAIFSVIGGYSARMTRDYTDYDQQRAEQRKVTLAKVQQAESKLLYPVDDQKKPTAEWIDQDKGVIRIPIDEAMSREVNTLRTKPAAMGGEIAAPAPAAAPPAAGATTPTTAPASTNAAPAAPSTPAEPNK